MTGGLADDKLNGASGEVLVVWVEPGNVADARLFPTADSSGGISGKVREPGGNGVLDPGILVDPDRGGTLIPGKIEGTDGKDALIADKFEGKDDKLVPDKGADSEVASCPGKFGNPGSNDAFAPGVWEEVGSK